MKKLFKVFLALSLALVCVLPIGLGLAGCSKNYTINIEVKTNGGHVYRHNMDGVSAEGKNIVKSGDKFEFFIDPIDGYVIDKVLIGGEQQADYDIHGAYMSIEKASKNVNVEVWFKEDSWTITFTCRSEENPDVYEEYTTKTIKTGTALDMTNDPLNKPGVNWYAMLSNKKYYLHNGLETATGESTVPGFIPYVIMVARDLEIRTDLTRAELEALLG